MYPNRYQRMFEFRTIEELISLEKSEVIYIGDKPFIVEREDNDR